MSLSETSGDASSGPATPGKPSRSFGLAAVATAGASLGAQMVFLRALGAEGFAQWALVNSLVLFFAMLTCFGASNLVLSEYYEGHLESPAGRRGLIRYFAMTGVVGMAGFVAIYGWAPLSTPRSQMDVVLGSVMLLTQIPVTLVFPLFQVRERAGMVASWYLIQNGARFIVSLVTLALALTFTEALGAWLVSAILICAWIAFDRASLPLPPLAKTNPRPVAPTPVTGSVATRGIMYGLAEGLEVFDLRIALPIIALFVGAREVSASGVGLLFLSSVYFFPYVFVMRFLLPAVHRGTNVDATLKRWLSIGLIASAIGGALFALFSVGVIAALLRTDYTNERWAFIGTGIAMIPVTISILASARFMAVAHQRSVLRWRLQSTLVFLVTLVVTAPVARAAAPFLAIALDRTYLSIRFLMASRALGTA